MNTFLIFAFPRSLTSWTSCLLTNGPVQCLHELSGRNPPDRIPSILRSQPCQVSGMVDSGALNHWRTLTDKMPEAELVWIDRDREECEESMRAASGMRPHVAKAIMDGLEKSRDEFLRSRKPRFFRTRYISTEEGAKSLWRTVAHPFLPPVAHLEKMLSLRVVQDPSISQQLLKTA